MSCRSFFAYILCLSLVTSHAQAGIFFWRNSSPPPEALELGTAIEKAKSLGAVFKVLRKIPGSQLGITERLMIYDRIPETVLDVSATLEKIRTAAVLEQDVSYAVEAVYLMELETQLKSSGFVGMIRADNRRFIRNQFLDSILEWKTAVEAQLSSNFTQSEIERAHPAVRASLTQRLESLSKALLAGMTEAQKEALLKKEQAFLKRNKHEGATAVSQVPTKHSEWMFPTAIGTMFGMFSPIVLMVALNGGSIPPPVAIGSVGGALVAIMGSFALKEKRNNETKSTKLAYKEREKLLDPFFEPIKADATFCAKSVAESK